MTLWETSVVLLIFGKCSTRFQMVDTDMLLGLEQKTVVGRLCKPRSRPWRVPATRPDPNFYFATRTIFQNFRVSGFSQQAVSQQASSNLLTIILQFCCSLSLFISVPLAWITECLKNSSFSGCNQVIVISNATQICLSQYVRYLKLFWSKKRQPKLMCAEKKNSFEMDLGSTVLA